MKTGGPAFPVPIAGDTGGFVDDQECGAPTGLTIRDYFAAKALGLCYADYLDYASENGIQEGWRDGVAKDAYLMADAMLKAREGE